MGDDKHFLDPVVRLFTKIPKARENEHPLPVKTSPSLLYELGANSMNNVSVTPRLLFQSFGKEEAKRQSCPKSQAEGSPLHQ